MALQDALSVRDARWSEAVAVGNLAFVKKVKRLEMPEEVAATDLAVIPDQLTLHASGLLLVSAFRLAIQHGRSLYDSLYVALALREQCQLVTADERLCNALRPAFGDTLLWLGDLPAASV